MSAKSPASKKNPLVRFLTMNTSGQTSGRDLPLWRQLLTQILCLFILFSVMFPIMYIVTLSLSSKTTRPSSLQLIPTEIWHGSKKLKKWTQDLYKLCNKVLSDSNKAIPAERVV